LIWELILEGRIIKFGIGKTEKEPKKITIQKYRQSDLISASHTNQTIAIRGSIARKGVYKSNVNKNKVPIVLITCKEAREAAKATYSLTFEKELAGKNIWVNFSRDTIVFEDARALAWFDRGQWVIRKTRRSCPNPPAGDNHHGIRGPSSRRW
jgi:hypothetical protein